MVATDGLKFMQTFSGNIVRGGNDAEGLHNPFRNRTKSGRGSAHSVEEVYQLNQLRSLKTGQIPFLFVVPNQTVEVAREIRRRIIERVEIL